MARASRRQLVTIAAMRSLTGNASSAARFLNRALICQVRVGFTESASFNPLVTCAFRSFRSAYPEVEVSLEEHPSTELAVALREGRIDAAFLRPPLKTEEGITLHLLEEEDMVVAVPNGHPLEKRKVIDLRELEMETFILYPRSVRPGLADAVVAACEKAGFTPRVEQYAPQLSATINLVAASLGISIVPRSMQGLQPHALAYLPLRGRPVLAQLGIAHRTSEESPAVLKFIELVRNTSAPQRAGTSRRPVSKAKGVATVLSAPNRKSVPPR